MTCGAKYTTLRFRARTDAAACRFGLAGAVAGRVSHRFSPVPCNHATRRSAQTFPRNVSVIVIVALEGSLGFIDPILKVLRYHISGGPVVRPRA